MHRLKELTKKTWLSEDKIFEIIVWRGEDDVKGELFVKSEGKRYSLREAISLERDTAYFPSKVSENLYRLIDEVKKS